MFTATRVDTIGLTDRAFSVLCLRHAKHESGDTYSVQNRFTEEINNFSVFMIVYADVCLGDAPQAQQSIQRTIFFTLFLVYV